MLEIMEKYAKDNNIPIIEKTAIEYIKKLIIKRKIKNILEIGSAIGYSAINMALVDDNIKITTIERDKVRYQEALKNIANFKIKNRIKIINDDALNIEIEEKFDLIFIDAAKSQSINFFKKFEKNLNKNGIIITDNIYFHGLTFSDKVESKNIKQLTRKIREYIKFLEENPDYKTEIVNVGDGIAISIRS